jgi:hypothetical protein
MALPLDGTSHLGWHLPVGCPLRGGRGEYKNNRNFCSTKNNSGKKKHFLKCIQEYSHRLPGHATNQAASPGRRILVGAHAYMLFWPDRMAIKQCVSGHLRTHMTFWQPTGKREAYHHTQVVVRGSNLSVRAREPYCDGCDPFAHWHRLRVVGRAWWGGGV